MNTAVIIVTYNSAATLAACLASVLAARQAGDELVVVDNASRDATPVILSRLAASLSVTHITVIQNKANLGFAAAVNQGIKASCSPLVALLNPDTVVPNGWQKRLASHFSEPQVAAVGPVSNFAAARQSVACHWQGLPPDGGGVQEAAERLYAINAGCYETTPLLIGFCLLLRRELLEKLGGLDERLFLGNDDLELSWRLRLHGYELRIATDCFVYHEGQHSFRTDPSSVTGRLVRESSNALYAILVEHYGAKRVPPPSELWNIDWFAPDAPMFNPLVRFHQVLILPIIKKTKTHDDFRPVTSIIILTWNQLRYTEECLAALARHTPESHEIIFVDNGSDDGTVEFLRNLVKDDSHYRLIENSSNRGFAAGCNQGLTEARGKFLVLLNNDVVVTPGWLSGLLDCHRSAPLAGIVGPLTNNASGIQGLGPNDYGSAGLDEFARQFHIRNLYRRISSRRLVGFCMLFSRQLYQEIGGLDERFGTGNYEDDDFCLRTAIAGYRNLIAGDIYVHHYGSVSFTGGGINYQNTMNGNWSLFQEKWSSPVTDQGEAARIARCRLREDLEQLILDEQYDKILEQLSGAGSEDVNDLLIRDIHARALWLKGRRGEAVSLLPSGSAAALTLQGCYALEAGDSKGAEALLWAAVSADLGCGVPYAYLAQLAQQRAEPEYAIELLMRGVTLTPVLMDFQPFLKNIVTQKQSEDLVSLLMEATRLYPESRRVAWLLVDWSAYAGLQKETVSAAEQFCVRFGTDDHVLATGLAARRILGTYSGIAPDGQQISLCMIVKDEERCLQHCLLSCRPLVEEMIVVDTGSQDHSSQIGELFGAQVLHYAWQDDFSSARNYSLAAAQGDWILVMDADERISASDYSLFKKILAETAPCGLVMTTRNYTSITTLDGFQSIDGVYPQDEGGLGWTCSTKVRLFPNHSKIRFEGVVHETVDESILRTGLTVQPHPVPVHHYGGLEKDRQTRKQRLYYTLGKRKVDQQRDSKSIYELAVQSGELGYWDEAAQLWQEFLGQEPGRAVAWFNLGYVLLRQGRMDDAVKATEHALAIQPDYPAAFVNLGICYFCLFQPETAEELLVTLMGRCPNDMTVRLLVALAMCLAGELSKGASELHNLQLSISGIEAFMVKLGELLKQVGRDDDAVLVTHLGQMLH